MAVNGVGRNTQQPTGERRLGDDDDDVFSIPTVPLLLLMMCVCEVRNSFPQHTYVRKDGIRNLKFGKIYVFSRE